MIDLKELDKFSLDDFIKDIFLGFLQQLFNQNPGEFHYDPDPKLSRILILDRFSYSNASVDFKPTIFIRRRPLAFMNTSIDQMFTANMMTGSKTYTDLIQGVVELVAISREGLEAARLASLVFLLVQEFKAEIRKLGVHDVSVKALGEEEIKKVGSTIELVEVPVTVQIVFQYMWATNVIAQTPLAEVNIGRKVSAGYCIPISSASPKPD